MRFINWIARRTTKSSDFARDYASLLVVMIDHLTASLVAFSGKQSFTNKNQKAEENAFENTFDMHQAGFDSYDDTIGGRLAPNIEEIKETAEVDLLNNTFKQTTAYLYLLSASTAYKYMKVENSDLFSAALLSFIAERCVNRFGFSSDPRQITDEINDLLPSFYAGGLLDSFALLIKHISVSQDGTVQYGFVVGSEKQKMGCLSIILKIAVDIDKLLKGSAKDFKW